MSVTRNMLVSTAISHLARYSSLASSGGRSEDDVKDEEFNTCDISSKHSSWSAVLSFRWYSLDVGGTKKKEEAGEGEEEKKNFGDRPCESAPATSARRKIHALAQCSYELPVLTVGWQHWPRSFTDATTRSASSGESTIGYRETAPIGNRVSRRGEKKRERERRGWWQGRNPRGVTDVIGAVSARTHKQSRWHERTTRGVLTGALSRSAKVRWKDRRVRLEGSQKKTVLRDESI